MFYVMLEYYDSDGALNQDDILCHSWDEAEDTLAEVTALDCCKKAWVLAA